MKKFMLMCSSIFFVVSNAAAQTPSYSRPTSIGISFLFFDYETPDRMRSSSFRQVLKNGDWANLNEMSPGLAITYFRGLHNRFDFAGNVTGTFADDAKLNYSNGGNIFLLQADAEVQFKFLPDKNMFTPYLLGGVGMGKYKSYYSAFMPLGAGFKVNFFDEAAFFVQAKYNFPVTDATINRHFVYGLGIAGIIGRKREVL